MGKGDRRRPQQISDEEMRKRWEEAFKPRPDKPKADTAPEEKRNG